MALFFPKTVLTDLDGTIGTVTNTIFNVILLFPHSDNVVEEAEKVASERARRRWSSRCMNKVQRWPKGLSVSRNKKSVTVFLESTADTDEWGDHVRKHFWTQTVAFYKCSSMQPTENTVTKMKYLKGVFMVQIVCVCIMISIFYLCYHFWHQILLLVPVFWFLLVYVSFQFEIGSHINCFYIEYI